LGVLILVGRRGRVVVDCGFNVVGVASFSTLPKERHFEGANRRKCKESDIDEARESKDGLRERIRLLHYTETSEAGRLL
jgi:hypothetical protein